jgi:hypothetical protein
VSRRPPPNTPHWWFLVRVFKEIAPRSWLKTAAEWAGFVNGRDLRRSVDRELNFEQMAQLDQFLVDCLEQHIQDLDRRRGAANNMTRKIWHSRNERRRVCETEKPVPERTLDEMLAGYPPLLRAAWAELLSDERTADKAA